MDNIKKLMLLSAVAFCGSAVADPVVHERAWAPYFIGAALGTAIGGFAMFLAAGHTYFRQKARYEQMLYRQQATIDATSKRIDMLTYRSKILANAPRWVEWKMPVKEYGALLAEKAKLQGLNRRQATDLTSLDTRNFTLQNRLGESDTRITCLVQQVQSLNRRLANLPPVIRAGSDASNAHPSQGG